MAIRKRKTVSKKPVKKKTAVKKATSQSTAPKSTTAKKKKTASAKKTTAKSTTKKTAVKKIAPKGTAKKTARKKRRRRHIRLEGAVSIAVSVILLFGVVGGGYYAWNRYFSDEEETTEEENTVPVYADVYAINQDVQIKNLKNAQAGDVVDAQGLSEEQLKMFFTAAAIDEDQMDKMKNVTIFEDELSLSPNDLLYLRVLHKDFDGNDVVGEMIVNANIAKDVLSLFYDLYQMKYPIEKIQLLDTYNGNLRLSHTDNNTSAFSQRNMEGKLDRSARAKGYVIDLNPFYNPDISEDGTIFPESSMIYVDRQLKEYSAATRKRILEENHMLTLGDEVVDLFESYGFYWQGDQKNPEYGTFVYRSAAKDNDS